VVLEGPSPAAIPGVTRDMEQVVNMIMVHDPKHRPTTTQLLGLPIMQHFLTLFLSIVGRDTKISQRVRTAIEENIAQVESDVRNNVHFDDDTSDPHYEGNVKKEASGQWKDRYLLLNPPDLVMTLAPGKEAAPGTDRSKAIPISHIASVVPTEAPADVQGKIFVFAVQLVNGTALVVGVESAQMRDIWVGKIMSALQMT
jgi:hypothetical protein